MPHDASKSTRSRGDNKDGTNLTNRSRRSIVAFLPNGECGGMNVSTVNDRILPIDSLPFAGPGLKPHVASRCSGAAIGCTPRAGRAAMYHRNLTSEATPVTEMRCNQDLT